PELNDPSWFGLVAPKNTPPAQIARVQKAVVEALKDPKVKARMDAQGLFVSGTSSEDFTRQIASEVAKMQSVAASANISVE
ncbi:MAG: tripartite tricarboxylate transporter substrate-binding protein, partial [Comamonas sp.]